MEEFEIRVKQLKQYKLFCFLRYLLLLFVSITISFLLVLLYHYFSLKNDLSFTFISIKFSEDLFKGCLIFIFILLNIIISIIFFIIENKKYKNNYLEYLINECKLDEIYYFINKIYNTKFLNQSIEKWFDLKNVKLIKSFSDASTKFRLNISEIRYSKRNTNAHFGLLFNVMFDTDRQGFLQISKNTFPAINEHENIEVIQYGFGVKSCLRKYHMYSTLGTDSYILEDNVNGGKIISISNYFNRPIELILENNELFVFINDYSLKFVDSLFSKINNDKFSDKIAAIKKMHQYFFDMIKMIDEIFITKAE